MESGSGSVGPEDAECAHRALEARGLIEPLALGGADEAVWLDCELASLAENRLGEIDDPMRLDDATRERWLSRATAEALYPPSERDLDRCYWLLDAGERAGTIALSTSSFGSGALRLASLYVTPSHRRRRVGTQILEASRDAAGDVGLELRLTTSWAWQRTLSLYLRLGLWVRAWKREVELAWRAREPAPVLETISDLEIALSVDEQTGRQELARARQSGDDLLLRSSAGVSAERSTRATSTLAMLLALRGWPLVRSAAHWDAHHLADAGAPEALAYRIMVWEAWDRAHGYRVETPRLRGLRYPSWEELEAGAGH